MGGSYKKENCKYYLISWERYLSRNNFIEDIKNLPSKGMCAVCQADNAGYIITLSGGFDTWRAGDICSEECFNMWLIRK